MSITNVSSNVLSHRCQVSLPLEPSCTVRSKSAMRVVQAWNFCIAWLSPCAGRQGASGSKAWVADQSLTHHGWLDGLLFCCPVPRLLNWSLAMRRQLRHDCSDGSAFMPRLLQVHGPWILVRVDARGAPSVEPNWPGY